MKILMIAPEPFFEPRGTPFSILERLKVLSELGHEVDLLTYHVGEDVEIERVAIFRNRPLPLIKKFPIGPSLVKLVTDMVLFGHAVSRLRKKRYDLLHTHEEASFFGVWLARWFGIPHLYDMHSSLPQQLTNFKYTRMKPVIGLFRWLERMALAGSAAVITICPSLQEYVRQLDPKIPQIMIENVPRDDKAGNLSEERVREFSERYGLAGKKVILYAGTMEPYQGLDLLLDAAGTVVRRSENTVFLLMGGKPHQVEDYRRRVGELGLTEYFRLTGQRPPEEVPLAIALADVLLSLRILGTNTPLKIYSYLRSGRPIVATNLSTHTQVLNEAIARLVDPNPSAVANGILSILNQPEMGREMGERAMEYFRKNYDYSEFIRKTRDVLQLAGR